MDEIPVKVGNETVFVRVPRSTMAFDPNYGERDPFVGAETLVRLGGKLFNYFKGNLYPVEQKPTPSEWIDREDPNYQGSIYKDEPMNISMGEITNLWHGSPHKFSKFDLSKAGSGEGVQAFGWGGYLTESKKAAAKHYSDRLAKGRGASPEDTAVRMLQATGGDKDAAVRELNRRMSSPDVLGDAVTRFQEAIAHVKADIRPSYLYKATLHKGKDPSEYTFMDWYEPVSGTNLYPSDVFNKIKAQVEKENIELSPIAKRLFQLAEEGSFTPTGRTVYDSLSKILGSQEEASKFLSRAGISGIRYPSDSLSGKASDKFNYVFFNEKDVTISKRLKKKY